MTNTSDDQTRPACPACGARLEASYDPGDECPNCEDGTLVALPEVVESDLGQQSDVAGAHGGTGNLDEFSSPPDFSGGLGDQDTTTRSKSIPEQTRASSDDGEQGKSGPPDLPGSRRLGQSVSESDQSDDPFGEWQEPSTAENPSLPEMQADELEKAEDASESDASSEQKASESSGFVPPPSSVVEEIPEEQREDETEDDGDRQVGRQSSSPAPTLPDDESDQKEQRRRPESAEASGELESKLGGAREKKKRGKGDRPSAEELLEEDESLPAGASSQQEQTRRNESSAEPNRAASRPETRQPTQGEATEEASPEHLDEDSVPSPTEAVQTGESSDGVSWVMLAGAGAVIGAVLFGGLVAVGIVNITGQSASEAQKKANDPDRLMEARAKAMTSATAIVERSTEVDTQDTELRRSVAKSLADAGRPAAASKIHDVLWRNGSRSQEFTARYVDLLIQGNRYHRARMIALAGARLHDGAVEEFRNRYEQAVEADASLGPPTPLDIGEDFDVRSVHRPTDRDADALMIQTNGSADYIFYPAQSEQRAWRNHVAAWRLCEVLGCSFEIPWTRTARITRRQFERASEDSLSASGGLVSEETASDEKISFRWRSPEGSDTEYLYGALRTWPGEMARWPIEAFEIWKPWMQADREKGLLDTPATKAWSEFADTLKSEQLEALRSHTGEQRLRPVAGQLSDILLFDYLTNNWGRFAPDSSKYGVNNHFRHGRFVTVDTDQTFQRRHSRRVKGRFSWTETFREETIFALRWIDKSQLLNIVYPEPSSFERAKFSLVWEQRNRVLERVEKLVGKHGDNRVYPFPVVPLWPAR